MSRRDGGSLRRLGHAACTATILALATGAAAQDEEVPLLAVSERPALRAGTLGEGFHLDGRLDDAAWQAVPDSIADLTMVEPDEGEKPTAPTIVKVMADANHIVVGVHCIDLEPHSIVSFSKARDSELAEEDRITIVFDTFLDGRSGYVFAINPSGARFDGLVAGSGDEVNAAWDAIWEAETARTPDGWSAEFRIPIESLYFAKGSTSWGFNIERGVPRSQETGRWSSPSLDYFIYQTSRAGLLTDLPAFDLGIGLTLRPAFVARGRTPGAHRKTRVRGEWSFDATQRLGPNMNATFTANTDFAETEVDVRQLNVTRFELFFPEKRSFFLEGSDIFEFGLGLDEENMLPLHTRRIGLFGPEDEDQINVPISVGGKVNGRMGNTNIGALIVNTDEVVRPAATVDDFNVNLPQTTMGAVRVSQNILEESSVGFLATVGDQRGLDDAWAGGVDFTFQTSSFRGEKNFLAGAWGMLNDRVGLTGDKSSWGARVEYPNDRIDVNLTSIHIGDGFDPSLGFVPRNNVHIWDFGSEYSPRPAVSWLRQTFYEASGTLFAKRNNSTWESYDATLKPLDWLFESGDRIDLGVTPEGDRPPTPFEVSGDIDIPAETYQWTRFFAGARAAEKRRLSGELRWEFGDYYNGKLYTVLGRLTVKPSALYAVELTSERNTGEAHALPDDYEGGPYTLTEKTFKEQTYGVRLLLNVSPDLQFSSLTQYDDTSRELGTNNRLRWTFLPGGDLFVVYNHNLVRRVRRAGNRWVFTGNEIPVKVQYAFRF